MGVTENDVTTGDDPTESILSKSGLNSKSLCDYVINVATGCRHGCKFCYVPSTPAIRARPEMLKEEADVDAPQKEWGDYVLYRDTIPERLPGILERKRTWRDTPHGQGIVGISFGTDCYMDGRAGEITRQTVATLADHEKHGRVLTRNPILALQDLDVFTSAGDYVTIGSSISSLNRDRVTAIEPRAPGPEHRLRGLKEFAANGVNTFVSMSPTYPTLSKPELRELLAAIADCNPDVIFHEPINPRSGNFRMTVDAARDAGQHTLASELDRIRDQEAWLAYSLKQFVWVQQLGAELDLPVHLWPDSRHLKHTEGRVHDWLAAWKGRQPPEDFAGRPVPDSSPPAIPTSLLEKFG